MTHSVLVLNGPNLNLLGVREPEVYGTATLADVENLVRATLAPHGIAAAFLQSNAEHILIERIHTARTDGTGFIVINPGALTHTSVALRDALTGVALPFIEVHISNIHAREPFRRHSFLSDAAAGVIAGLGIQGYAFAAQAAADALLHRQ